MISILLRRRWGTLFRGTSHFLEKVLHRELFIVGPESILAITLLLLEWLDRGSGLALPECLKTLIMK
jgi:hypothetical protein